MTPEQKQATQFKCMSCKDKGWEHPNLGVNCPAGSAVALATASAMNMQNGGGPLMFRCMKCNADGKKPQPVRIVRLADVIENPNRWGR